MPAQASKTIFITGGSGYIGTQITIAALKDGYAVRSLSRTEKSDATISATGATPVRGNLFTLDVLRSEAAKADIVFHLAHCLSDGFDLSKYDAAIDAAAVDALGEDMKGTDKSLVVTSGTLMAKADPAGGETTEETPYDETMWVRRDLEERHALTLVQKGVKVMVIRLAPYVYGHGRSGVALFMAAALQSKQAVYVDDGQTKTTTVHVDDAARLYLLAAEQGKAGDVFNASDANDITLRQMAEAYAAALGVPAVSITKEEAEKTLGPFFSHFLTTPNRASNAKAKRVLGWEPKGPGLFEEISKGSYRQYAQSLVGGQQGA